MKKITFGLFALLCTAASYPVQAGDLMVASTMQHCATDTDCALVANSCQDSCASVPVNKENLQTLQTQYQSKCGKAMDANPACTMNPPLSAACINARCTIDYAYKNNGSEADYQSGAYAVPEAPVPSKVPSDAYKNVDDRKGGFSAYNLPKEQVRDGTVGTIHDKIYVPPSAPVSGGNYIPLGQAAQPQATVAPAPAMVPQQPSAAPATPPAATTTPVMAAPVATPAPAVPATPQQTPAPSPAVPMNDVPAMTPSLPNQQVPTPPPVPAAIPAPAVPAAPTSYIAPDSQPTGDVVIPSVGAPGVPVAPPGSQPIPRSDLTPPPSLVPPAGSTSAVNPDDPGAPPPKGTKIIMKGSEMESEANKSFTAKSLNEKKAAKLGSFN